MKSPTMPKPTGYSTTSSSIQEHLQMAFPSPADGKDFFLRTCASAEASDTIDNVKADRYFRFVRRVRLQDADPKRGRKDLSCP